MAPKRQVALLAVLGAPLAHAEKNAADIPRANTPSPGEWPQANVTGCGFPGLPITTTLADCTEPLNPQAPDLRGYWKTAGGDINEHIDMCGSRWIDVSKPVLHDFPACTGVVGDGEGCQDYAGPLIVNTWAEGGGACSPIVVACKFETDDEGNGCVNLYTQGTTGQTVKVVSRCLQSDNETMIWIHPLAGTVVYTRVPKEEEPNCIVCEGGEHDGFETSDTEAQMPSWRRPLRPRVRQIVV
ncbi:hypothetical protein ACHAXT_011650 [Thalassiosira profunda]